MVSKLTAQKYNGARGKADLVKRIADNLLKAAPGSIDAELVWASYGLGQLTCGKHNVNNPKPTNCKENPYCLGRLGLEKFEKLIKKSEELRNEKMIDTERRDVAKQPCGLVNWANFCYVNSFLQIWFNDPVFRQIIYDWRPSPDYKIPAPPSMNVQQVMDALQHLFFSLETTPYEDANGENFCTALRLNAEQQDAQEFTVMFFDSIDRNLMKHPNGQEMRQRIAERFNGLQTSRLRCTCKYASETTTKFSALNLSIDGHTSLSASIAGYFADEELSDFACSGCGRRGHVVRETRIDHMPPVLLLSLNRYVYDSNTGRRKKLKTPLQYPRVLDVTGLPHGEQLSKEESRYELSAVMVHEGDSADCGHYWDIIRHPFEGSWYKYNDKSVKETKAPGVETEKAEAPAKPSIDLKYCYGLVYRRKEPAAPLRHPAEETTALWTREMEHKFYRMTDTGAQASDVTLEEVTQRFNVVREHLANLEVKPNPPGVTYCGPGSKHRKPKDLAFLPTKLISDILATEYTRAVKMKEELEKIADQLDNTCMEDEDGAAAAAGGSNGLGSDSGLPSPTKRKTNMRRRVKSMYDKRLEQVEIATSLSPASLTLCPHQRIFYESVLNGDVRIVNRAAAEKLIADYGLVVSVAGEGGGGGGAVRSDRLKTGLDVCAECVAEQARDLRFKHRLEEDAGLAARVLKESSTRCSMRAFHQQGRAPPAGSLYVAKSALTHFKRDAQRERSRRAEARKAGRLVWTVGPAGGGASGGRKRRKRTEKEGGASASEAAADDDEEEEEEEEGPMLKCARSSEEAGVKAEKEEDGVEEALRGLVDELSGAPPTQLQQANGRAAAAADKQQQRRENGRRPPKAEVKTEEEEGDGKEEAAVDVKREGKEGSSATEDSVEQPASPGGANGAGGGRGEAGSGGSSSGKEEEKRNGTSDEEEGGGGEGGPVCFNEQLRCEHGGVNLSEFRHAVSPEEWATLTGGYFESTFEVTTDRQLCGDCQGNAETAKEDRQASSAILRTLTEAVGDILKAVDKRMNGGGAGRGEKFTRGVCSRFIEKARKCLNPRSKGRTGALLPPLCQQCVLCDHGRPRYETAPLPDGDDLFIVPLTADEWRRLRAAWSEATAAATSAAAAAAAMGAGAGRSPGRGEEAEAEDDEDGYAQTDIELCPVSGMVSEQCVPCNAELKELIEAQRYIFDNADIYVKLQTDDGPSTSKSAAAADKEGPAATAPAASGADSKEGSEENQDVTPLQVTTTAATATSSGRGVGAAGGRSRRGQSKGLIKVRMSSTQSVKELKIALLKHVNYSPVDQLLYSRAGADPLEDDLTLMEARILPENHEAPIILIVQSAVEGGLCSPTSERNRAVERGFYDTALAH